MNKYIKITIIASIIIPIIFTSIFVTFELVRNYHDINVVVKDLSFQTKSSEDWLEQAENTKEVKTFFTIYPNATSYLADYTPNNFTIVFTDYNKVTRVQSSLEVSYYSLSDFPDFELHCSGPNGNSSFHEGILSYLLVSDCQELLFDAGSFEFYKINLEKQLELKKQMSEFFINETLKNSDFIKFDKLYPNSIISADYITINSITIKAEKIINNKHKAVMVFYYNLKEFESTDTQFSCFINGEKQLKYDIGFHQFDYDECRELVKNNQRISGLNEPYVTYFREEPNPSWNKLDYTEKLSLLNQAHSYLTDQMIDDDYVFVVVDEETLTILLGVDSGYYQNTNDTPNEIDGFILEEIYDDLGFYFPIEIHRNSAFIVQ